MASIEQLGLATQEQSVLLELLDHGSGVVIVVGVDPDLRLRTYRTLIHHLETKQRDVTPWMPEGASYDGPLFDEGWPEDGALQTVQMIAPPTLARLRPQVVLMPQLEDGEDLDLACEQGTRGHLALATGEGLDGAGFLARRLREGADRTLVSQALLGVITQHQVPKACPLCRVDLAPSFELEDEFERSFGQLGFPFPGFSLREGRGCHTCNYSGTLGSIQVFEFLQATPLVREMIGAGGTLEAIDARAMEEGMLPWEAKLYFRLKHGEIALCDSAALLRRAQSE